MADNSKLGSLSSIGNIVRSPLIILVLLALGLVGAILLTVHKFQSSSEEIQQISEVLEPIKTVTALGRLEPDGEVIQISPPSATVQGGNRVEQLLVKEGMEVKAGQVIAIMDNVFRLEASLKEAQKQAKVATSRLAQVRAGAEQGEIEARQASVKRLEAELFGQIKTTQAEIKRLEVQLKGEIASQNFVIKRLESELQGQKQATTALKARVAANKRNAITDVRRYENLYFEGVISNQEVDRRRLIAENSTQELIEAQANQTRSLASLQQQIKEAKANRDKTAAMLQQQINSALSNRNKTIVTLEQQINESKGLLKQTIEVRPTDVATAQAEADSANATVERIKAELAQSKIRAPKPGRLLKINTRAGEAVGNQGIVEIGQTNQMYAVAEVYQSDINKIRTGQRVRIVNETLEGELQGRVERIGAQVQRQNIINSDPSSNLDAKVVEVYVLLDKASSKKAANLTNLQVQAVIQL